MRLMVNGRLCHALVDTGCEETVVFAGLTPDWEECEADMMAVNGSAVRCCGKANVCLEVQGRRVTVRAVVVRERLMGLDVLLGMTGVEALGGVFVGSGGVRFGCGEDARGSIGGARAAACQMTAPERRRIETADFVAEFGDGKWSVRWKWVNGAGPQWLKNTVPQYAVPDGAREKFDAELRLWIKEGWLQLYDEREHGPARGLIPLMAVVQTAKDKIRPVLDYRELNEHLAPHTADADVCSEQLRKWRRHGDNVAVIDLKKAFLQLHVVPELWPFQTVVVGGQRYCLTRVGFGLSVAPLIMKAVVREVLDQDPRLTAAVLPYADDLLVNETIVSSAEVVRHFARFGLACKPPERAADGARLLGLRVEKDTDGVLQWKRDGETPARPPDVLTRRSVFAWTGQLTSHMPVAGWLRPAVAWLKRSANKLSDDWDTPICDENFRKQVEEVARRVEQADPSRGQWCVTGDAVIVWTDASSIARGVVLADPSTDAVIEDAAWLRTDRDTAMHINMAELDSTVNGVNMAVAWGFRRLDVRTDSVTVQRWLNDALSGKTRLRTKAQSEMLIRRRVAVFHQLVAEYELEVSVTLVPSAANRADELTRVPKEWLQPKKPAEQPPEPPVVAAVRKAASASELRAVHENIGHQGVRRTLWYARRELGTTRVTKSAVRAIVKSCQVCASIDPAPERWKHGSLEVERTWDRLAMDVTHFRGHLYLTLVDCGPSRYAIWRQLGRSEAGEIVKQLESIFLERGAPNEILTDNATEFRGRAMMALAARWDINVIFRAAYEPGGNGIVERNHRTIKVMATRQACSVQEAVHRYNVTPKDGQDVATAPMNEVFRHPGGDVGVSPQMRDGSGPGQLPAPGPPGVYRVGDAVWVRKRGDRCTSKSAEGVVTKVVSLQTVEVDGVPRHVRNLRHRLDGTAEPMPSGLHPTTPTADDDSDDDDAVWLVPLEQAPGQLAIEEPPGRPPDDPTCQTDDEVEAGSSEGEEGVKEEVESEVDSSTEADEHRTASDAEAEPRRGTRLRHATQWYGDPVSSDVLDEV